MMISKMQTGGDSAGGARLGGADNPNLQEEALEILSALAQSTRLDAFRMLAVAGKDGLGAGAMAKALGTPHNTLSTHLAILQRAGLITSSKEGRNVTYYLVPSSLQSLVSLLIDDCAIALPDDVLPQIAQAIEGLKDPERR